LFPDQSGLANAILRLAILTRRPSVNIEHAAVHGCDCDFYNLGSEDQRVLSATSMTLARLSSSVNPQANSRLMSKAASVGGLFHFAPGNCHLPA
jgi:hypothetical protein